MQEATIALLLTPGVCSQILLVLLSPGDAYIVDLRKQYRGRFELCEVQDDSDDESQSSKHRHDTVHIVIFLEAYMLCRSIMTVARFDPSGKHVFIGTSNGFVLVFNTRTKTV